MHKENASLKFYFFDLIKGLSSGRASLFWSGGRMNQGQTGRCSSWFSLPTRKELLHFGGMSFGVSSLEELIKFMNPPSLKAENFCN